MALLLGCSKPPPVSLPRLSTSVVGMEIPQATFVVELTADGRVLVQRRPISLDELSGRLDRLLPEWPRSRDTLVRLRLDREAAWGHVRWLVGVLAKNNAGSASFVYDGPDGDVDLEISVWPEWLVCALPDLPELGQLWVRVAILDDWKIRCGPQYLRDPSEIDAWLATAHARVADEGLGGVSVEILPQNNARVGTVLAVFERVRAAGLSPFFSGHTIAPENVRRTGRLPPCPPDLRPKGGMEIERWRGPGFTFPPDYGDD